MNKFLVHEDTNEVKYEEGSLRVGKGDTVSVHAIGALTNRKVWLDSEFDVEIDANKVIIGLDLGNCFFESKIFKSKY